MPVLRALLLVLALVGVLLLPAAAGARVPADWSGVTIDYPPLLTSPSVLSSEMRLMKTSHVGRVRASIYWSFAQPYRQMRDVPKDQRDDYVEEDGVPTKLSGFDSVVENAARHGLGVLPVVLGSPHWAAGSNPGGTLAQPRGTAGYARFVTTLVRRYGPRGKFWLDHPDLPVRPIRQWQIWNEPNLAAYWKPPFQRPYAALLRAAYRAIHTADPGAKVVSAALASASWRGLERIYEAGMRGSYDILGVNAFTQEPANLPRAVARNRQVQLRHHDPRPILVSEITWDASRGRIRFRYPWSTNERDQATRLTQAYTALAAVRRKYDIVGVFWYAWLTPYAGRDPFFYSGLRTWNGKGQPRSKPALAAYQRVLGRL